MAYHFFTRWKKLSVQVISIEEDIKETEEVYTQKIRLFDKVWRALDHGKIDFDSVKGLLKIYRHEQRSNPYSNIATKLYSTRATKILKKNKNLTDEFNSLRDLVAKLCMHLDDQVKLARKLLDDLSANRLPDKSKFYDLKDMLALEGQFLRIEDKEFKKVEEAFLILNDPGADSGGYVDIITAIEKGIVKFKDNKLWIGEKPIQGLSIKHNKIALKGDHYTAMQNARWIAGDEYVQPSLSDPYSYFVERGKLTIYHRSKIQKMLGISNAESVVSLKILVFPEQLYIKIKKGMPVKFAVAHLRKTQVKDVIRHPETIAA